MILTTDDLCPSNLQFFKYWDEVHNSKPNMKLIAFTIANYKLKENIKESGEFRKWWEQHKDWVEIAIHGYDHMYPPEAERNELEECVEKALDILRPYLPKEYGYRSPGFHFTIRLEPILKKLGFSYVAYRDNIKYFDGRFLTNLVNTHCTYDKWDNPIGLIYQKICGGEYD